MTLLVGMPCFSAPFHSEGLPTPLLLLHLPSKCRYVFDFEGTDDEDDEDRDQRDQAEHERVCSAVHVPSFWFSASSFLKLEEPGSVFDVAGSFHNRCFSF